MCVCSGESINNAAGNGFDGYDDRGNPKWDLLSNINIWKIEFATNVRDYTYYWNLTTGLWLRRCVLLSCVCVCV